MGLRQPTRIGTFFAQAKAGAEQQKEAREKLKKPQALGGAAAAGTQMAAAQTGAQQQATQQVKDTTTKATTDLVAGNVGGQTAMAITGGTATPVPSVVKVASGETGDVAAVEKSGTEINNNIAAINNQITALDTKLTSASTEEAKAINDEKTRLNALLTGYQEQLSKGNLGQVAGPSAFEQQMSERESLLASDAGNIAKLASIFGPRWVAGRYGGLASQIYGKDLEAIQEAAGAGLSEREKAKRLREASLKQYSETLGASKKAFEEKLDTASSKLDILKKSPEELAGYKKDELIKLFGEDANKLFTFDANGNVTGTLRSSTRSALDKTLKDQEAEQLKVAGETTKAQTKKEEIFKTAEANIFGDTKSGGGIAAFKNQTSNAINNAQRIAEKIEDITNSWYKKEWSGISRDSWIAQEVRNKAGQLQNTLNKKAQEIEAARKNKDTTKMQSLYDEYAKVAREQNKEIEALWNQMSENARRL